jgi:predicted PurR-regulated permease PerM
MLKSKYFAWAIWTILILLIVLLGREVSFIFKGIVVLIQMLFIPVFLSMVLYYILSPLVDFLYKHRVPKGLSVLLIYFLFGCAIILVVILLGPVMYKQFVQLAQDVPVLIDAIRDWLINLKNTNIFRSFQGIETFSFERMADNFAAYIGSAITSIGNNLSWFVSFLTNLLISIILVPFILFYMLIGDSNPLRLTMKLIPEKHTEEAESILTEMSDTLGQYIQGQMIVSLCVGVLVYIGLLIIGLEYALALSFIAMITNVVPFVGPIIGTIPALILALLNSPWMALKVLLLIIVVQQLESLIISPRVIGRKLAIHPIIIILLVIFAGKLAGILGIILAIPTYAIGKVVFTHLLKLWKLRQKPK